MHGFDIIASRIDGKQRIAVNGDTLVGKAGKIPLLAVHFHSGGIQIAEDGYGDPLLLLVQGSGTEGNGGIGPLEREGDLPSVYLIHSHAGGIEITAVVMERVLGTAMESPSVHLKCHDVTGGDVVAGCQHKQIFHTVDHGHVHIIHVTQAGEDLILRIAHLHGADSAGILMDTPDNGHGTVAAHHGRIQIGFTYRHTLGGGTSVCTSGYRDAGPSLIGDGFCRTHGGNKRGNQHQSAKNQRCPFANRMLHARTPH